MPPVAAVLLTYPSNPDSFEPKLIYCSNDEASTFYLGHSVPCLDHLNTKYASFPHYFVSLQQLSIQATAHGALVERLGVNASYFKSPYAPPTEPWTLLTRSVPMVIARPGNSVVNLALIQNPDAGDAYQFQIRALSELDLRAYNVHAGSPHPATSPFRTPLASNTLPTSAIKMSKPALLESADFRLTVNRPGTPRYPLNTPPAAHASPLIHKGKPPVDVVDTPIPAVHSDDIVPEGHVSPPSSPFTDVHHTDTDKSSITSDDDDHDSDFAIQDVSDESSLLDDWESISIMHINDIPLFPLKPADGLASSATIVKVAK